MIDFGLSVEWLVDGMKNGIGIEQVGSKEKGAQYEVTVAPFEFGFAKEKKNLHSKRSSTAV